MDIKSTICVFVVLVNILHLHLVDCQQEIYAKQDKVENSDKIHINILLLLPTNDTYKFSLSKVLWPLNMAINEIKQIDYGSKFQVEITSDSCDCTGIKAPVNAMENIYRKRNHTKNFQAVFGPMCDYSLAPVARYAPFWDVAVITVSAMAQDFRKNKFTEYKTLTNIGPTMYWLDKFVTKVFSYFDWKQVIFIFDKDYQEQITNFNCYLTMASLKAALLNSKVTVDYKIRDKQDSRSVESILIDYVGNKFSVVLLCGGIQFVHDIMIAAQKLGFINGEYVFINFDLYAQMHNEDRLLRPWRAANSSLDIVHLNNITNSTSNSSLNILHAYEGLLTVTLKLEDKDGSYRGFQRKLVEYSNHYFKNESEVNYFIASFYDAIHIYIKALNKTVSSKHDVNDIPAVLRHIWNKKFDGVTGQVVIDNFGERISEFSLYDMNPFTYKFESVISSVINDTNVVLEYNEKKRPIFWLRSKSGPFADSPECGYNRAKCHVPEPTPIWVWLSITMGIIMLVTIVIGGLLYWRAKFEAELKAMNWLIKWEDVSNSMNDSDTKSTKLKRNRAIVNHQSDVDAEKTEDMVSLASVDLKSVHGKAVVYKRNWCFIKKINRNKIEITRNLLLEVKKIKDLQNDHITRFIGICLEPDKQFIFTEYCQKGSLQDILENQQIELESSFKHHLIHDIIKGMLFIHSSEIKFHGNLTSSNCVVDSRFTLKITDFGVPMLRTTTYIDEEHYYKKQLWKAPELQAPYSLNPNMQLFNGTQKGDVYSFAIIIQEILYRRGVFYLSDEDKDHLRVEERKEMPNSKLSLRQEELDENDDISYKRIFQNVKRGLRPTLDNNVCSKEIIELLRRCWTESATDRPDFSIIRDIMKKTTKISGNILDNLLARMEKYANNLEEIVKERTVECENERKRAESLLYRLLPPTVAAQLMLDKDVKAESFKSVTIYFSDICGFTNLSANSTPMQVVHLLNGLYTLFDSIIEGFDVYKVETIGDAYMVVSGLPQRNENHASEIARMSLALLENVENFKIPHLPTKKLELRIGLHTGPCVAGVVGLKMPRYCLFGDTVNTASRMESNGSALRIHISPQTKEALDKSGSFIIELRGPVEMKGKGVITTYWLLGENGKIVDKHSRSK